MQRTDKVLDKNGDLLTALDLMAIFRVEDGKVTWSRDCFFDSRAFGDLLGDGGCLEMRPISSSKWVVFGRSYHVPHRARSARCGGFIYG